MTAYQKLESNYTHAPNGTLYRSHYWQGNGYYGDHHSPSSYGRVSGDVFGSVGPEPGGGYFTYNAGNVDGNVDTTSAGAKAAYNRCFGKFTQLAQGVANAQIGVCFAEWRESAHMIENRSRQVLGLSRKVRSGFRPRGLLRKVSDVWLEYSFGWKPLFNDIWSGYNVLCSPVTKAHGVHTSTTFSTKYSVGTHPVLTVLRSGRVQMGAFVQVTNPNVALLEQLGLLNPASIIWELVPWSFVADWMFDISGLLDSWSALAGLGITGSYTTKGQNSHWQSKCPHGACSGVDGAVSRSPGVPSGALPNTAILNNIGSSLTRAANALALAVQIIDHGSRPRR
jgi:hypothetical protein